MNSNRLLEVLGLVSLADMNSYLSASGWHELETTTKWKLFRNSLSSGNSLELLLPASERFRDAGERIRSALFALADFEQRGVEEICKEIFHWQKDSLRVTSQVPGDQSSIPLQEAANRVRGLKDLLLYSGSSELDCRPHFDTFLPGALKSLAQFRFCHTFSGSFGFEVAGPVVAPGDNLDLFEPPIGRRIIERIAIGLKNLQAAMENESPDMLVEGFERGLNAKMCDSLVHMTEDGEVPVQIEIQWASSFEPPPEVRGLQPVKLKEGEVSILKYASERLKLVEPHDNTVIGRVVDLHCIHVPSDDHAKRTIEVRVKDAAWGTITVRMSLGPEAYALANQLHLSGGQIKAAGKLQRKGSTWSLNPVVKFEAVDG